MKPYIRSRPDAYNERVSPRSIEVLISLKYFPLLPRLPNQQRQRVSVAEPWIRDVSLYAYKISGSIMSLTNPFRPRLH